MSKIVGPDGLPADREPSKIVMFAELATEHPKNARVTFAPIERSQDESDESFARRTADRLVAVEVPPNCVLADPSEVSAVRSALICLAQRAHGLLNARGADKLSRGEQLSFANALLYLMRGLQQERADKSALSMEFQRLFEEQERYQKQHEAREKDEREVLRAAFDAGVECGEDKHVDSDSNNTVEEKGEAFGRFLCALEDTAEVE